MEANALTIGLPIAALLLAGAGFAWAAWMHKRLQNQRSGRKR